MPRKPGVENKRSQMLLRKLEEDHNFSIVKELIELYGYGKEIVVHYTLKVRENLLANRIATFGMNNDEVEMYNNKYKDVVRILVGLLSFCYPKLKAMEINQGMGDKIIFNITGIPDIFQEKESKQLEYSEYVDDEREEARLLN